VKGGRVILTLAVDTDRDVEFRDLCSRLGIHIRYAERGHGRYDQMTQYAVWADEPEQAMAMVAFAFGKRR